MCQSNDSAKFLKATTTRNFRISDTFTDSLTKLTGGERKVVKLAALPERTGNGGKN